MLHKGKLLVFLGSFVIVLYGASAAFYGKVVAKDDDAYKEIAVLMDVLSKVDEDYVEPPDMNKVEEGAMRGLIAALDPYSSYLTKEQYEELKTRKETGNAGAGMVLSKRSDVIYVVSCERKGPADQAGIRPGDYLISINGNSVEDKSILEVESLLHGAADSKIKVEIFRNSESKPIEKELTLQEPPSVVVRARIVDGNVGFLNVASLAGSAVGEIRNELLRVISLGAEKLVLDLRDCADGESAAGADLANFFLRDGMIYFSQDKKGDKIQVVEADPGKFITQMPVVVIINESTASAAEIAAGALKDRERAIVIGEKSFGVGSIQKTVFLKSGGVLVLSTAKYCTPSGKVIQDETLRNSGITPDILVPDDDTRQNLVVESYYDNHDEAVKYRLLMEKIDQFQPFW
jgi:carboxyl-terminal processing protease